MKFALTKEHRDYFEKRKSIEFEELLSPIQLEEITAAIDATLAIRSHLRQHRESAQFPASTSDQAFMKGRDLWRDHPALLRIARHTRFVEMTAELMQQKSLRLAYDQYFSIKNEASSSCYQHFFDRPSSLRDVSCLQGLVGGLILCLSGSSPDQLTDFFPCREGYGTFFSADCPIPFDQLGKCKGQTFLLIAYAKPNAVYICEEKDPHLHQWKKIGYAFGDKLLDKLHPIVCR